MLRVGIVGMGKRAQQLYLPTLLMLSDIFSVVGVCGRGGAKTAESASYYGVPLSPSVAALGEPGVADFIVVCVPPASVESVLRTLLPCRIPLLVETPFTQMGLVQAAEAARCVVGVCEQKPYLPIQQFQEILLRKGIIGTLKLAVNDFRGYGYHGVSQLRRSIGYDAIPVNLSGVSSSAIIPPFIGVDGNEKNIHEEWECGVVKFSNGATLVHLGTNLGTRIPEVRGSGSLRLYGDRGTLWSDGSDEIVVRYVHERAAYTIDCRIERGSRGNALRIAGSFPGYGEIVWESPYHLTELTDDQMGIAEHLLEMGRVARQGTPPLYPAERALLDYQIWEALKR